MQKFDENHASEVMLMTALKIKFQHFFMKLYTLKIRFQHSSNLFALPTKKKRLSCSISIKKERQNLNRFMLNGPFCKRYD